MALGVTWHKGRPEAEAFQGGTVEVNLEPASRSVAVGEVFTMTIQVDPHGQPVSGIDAFIDFTPSYLQVQAITNGGTLDFTFPTNSYNNTAGAITYSAGTFTSFPTTPFPLAVITLKALAATPGTNFGFSIAPDRQTRADYLGQDNITRWVKGAVVAIRETRTPLPSQATPPPTPTPNLKVELPTATPRPTTPTPGAPATPPTGVATPRPGGVTATPPPEATPSAIFTLGSVFSPWLWAAAMAVIIILVGGSLVLYGRRGQ
ncbi:MAG: hypothetical protein HYU86_03210 [Chloroflexi bacterium]|nr:hypothetical protein [Chloroflexota bacterium]